MKDVRFLCKDTTELESLETVAGGEHFWAQIRDREFVPARENGWTTSEHSVNIVWARTPPQQAPWTVL